MIAATDIDGLTGIHPTYKANKYPAPGHAALPRMYWVGLWIASRGGGKTYSCAQLLKMYERHGVYDTRTGQACHQRVILLTPTFDANPVWTSLKHLDFENDVHSKYSDALLVRVVEDVKREAEATETYCRRCRAWDKAAKYRRPEDIPKEIYEVLMETQLVHPSEWGEVPKYTRPTVTFLILDDLVGSDAFKSVGKSALTQLVLRNRHCRICIAILSQSLKSVPRSIRMNASVFVLFKFANMRVLDDLYEEISNLLTESEFVDLFKYATNDKHGSLIIDQTQADKTQRLKLGWEIFLLLQ
jgi:hypothetical protein